MDFYHHICNKCLKSPSEAGEEGLVKFPSCTSCKLVSYCCRSHQKADWKGHKTFCREVNKLLLARHTPSLFAGSHEMTHLSLYSYQTKLTNILEKNLTRELTFSERSMIYFPDICGKCRRFNGSAFISCEKCKLQFYCSNDHRDEHSGVHAQDCKPMKMCFELFQFLSNYTNTPPSKCIQRIMTPPQTFPDTLDEYIDNFMEMESVSLFDKVIYSDILSYVLTIVYALRQNSELCNKAKFSIHIIGATLVESYILNILESFFLWFENLVRLDLLFLGPECPYPDHDYIDSIREKHCDKNVNIVFKPGVFYHDFMNNSLDSCSPDAIVAFNCGFHEFRGQQCDSWVNTIDFLLSMKEVMLITTSYTLREAKEDSLPFLDLKSVHKIKVCERNPFRSINPHRNPEPSESAVYFFNQFLSIFMIKNIS